MNWIEPVLFIFFPSKTISTLQLSYEVPCVATGVLGPLGALVSGRVSVTCP